MAAYTTETITPKYHEALVAWQKKNFPEFDFLEKNWTKFYPSQTPYRLVAKIGKLQAENSATPPRNTEPRARAILRCDFTGTSRRALPPPTWA